MKFKPFTTLTVDPKSLEYFLSSFLFRARIRRFQVGAPGQTPEERLQKHLANHSGFTRKAKDWEMVYSESFPSKEEAGRRERQIKSWNNDS